MHDHQDPGPLRDAAETLAKDGIDAEVIDVRSLRPLDQDTILASVSKTHRAVLAYEGWPYGGVGAEIVDRIQRLAFDELDAPVLRATTTGISGVIDAQGVVRQALPQHRPARLDGIVPLALPPTLFAQLGNLLPLVWATLLLVAALVALRRRPG